MAGPRPQSLMGLVPGKLDQPRPSHGGPMLGKQVVEAGLVARIGRHSVLLRGKRVAHAGLEAGLGKSPLGSQVVGPRTLDRHDEVLDAVLLLRLANHLAGRAGMHRLGLKRPRP